MSTGIYKMVDGETIELTEAEHSQLVADQAAVEAALAADAWRTNRIEAYGPLADQLDEQYHDFDAWKARIAAVKAQFPKPA